MASLEKEEQTIPETRFQKLLRITLAFIASILKTMIAEFILSFLKGEWW
jgi:hypothetical protein